MHDFERKKRRKNTSKSLLELFLISIISLGIVTLLGVALCGVWFYALLDDFSRSLDDPEPPGYSGWLSSNDWNKENIGYFLTVPIPEDAINLEIEGSMGLRGSLGIIPRLSFSFYAPPQSATEFVNAFCDGILHPGYNPLVATDSYAPTEESVFILGKRMMHYSHSPGVPDTIKGNRCQRHDKGWIEEIVIDTSNHEEYVVSYNLPYSPNSANEYYPVTRKVTPFPKQFKLYVFGLRTENADSDSPLYIVENHTICLATSSVSGPIWDYFMFNPEAMTPYTNSDVTIFIDEIEQPAARMDKRASLLPLESDFQSGAWEYYCLDSTVWEQGTHTMQLIVEPDDGEALTLEWEFEVR
jgi:hypothetical protein